MKMFFTPEVAVVIGVLVLIICGLVCFSMALLTLLKPDKPKAEPKFKTLMEQLQHNANNSKEPFFLISKNLAGQSTGIDRTTYLKLIDVARDIVTHADDTSDHMYEAAFKFLEEIFHHYTMAAPPQPEEGEEDDAEDTTEDPTSLPPVQ